MRRRNRDKNQHKERDLKRIVKALNDGVKVKEIAEALRMTYSAFTTFLNIKGIKSRDHYLRDTAHLFKTTIEPSEEHLFPPIKVKEDENNLFRIMDKEENIAQNIREENKVDINEDRFDILSDDKKRIYKLEQENNLLKKSINQAREHVYDSDKIADLINRVSDANLKPEDVKFPDWFNKNSKNSIIPVFCLSDTHIGAVIDPADVNFVNEYNVEVARKRIYQLTDDFIDIYINKMSNYQYPGVLVLFGGDMIEQAMHGSEETNDLTVIDQTIEATNILITVLAKLEKHFKKVTVIACSGNHGRLIADKYVKNTNRLGNSLEKIIYHFIGVYFKDNENVKIITRQSDVIHFRINGKTWRMEHGCDIKFTGQAISGPLNSFERARLKRNSVDSAVGRTFDYFVFGHFHQHLISNSGLIVMDSTKGYDPYVMRMALPYSLPGATTFSINSRGEIIYATNLKCREDLSEREKHQMVIF